jgi:transaldolase/glucose-6-phosphate isomerase
VATAIAGSILGINAFHQPDVEASKIATRTLTSEYEKTGALPKEAPFFEGEGVKLFADAVNADALQKATGSDRTLAGLLKAHLGRLGAGDYFATSPYVPMTAAHEETIQGFRHACATGGVWPPARLGPRFPLDRPGPQGRPNTGVFPRSPATTPRPRGAGQAPSAWSRRQAGDSQVSDRKRRALRVHLGPEWPRA